MRSGTAISKYIEFYNGKPVHEKFYQWQTGCEGIRSLTQNYLHISVWDLTLIENYLSSTGFINIQEFEFRKGKDPYLLMDDEGRAWETLYVEVQKP